MKTNNKLGNVSDAQFNTLINRALARGTELGIFDRPKGTSGPVKLAKGDKKASSPTATKAAPKAAAPEVVAAPKPKAAASKKTVRTRRPPRL